MSHLRIAACIVACGASWSCASARLYPVCFYNEQPSQRAVNEYYLPGLQAALKSAFGDFRRVDVVGTPDGRWLVTRATKRENASAARVWPRIACIGSAMDSFGVERERDCVSYVAGFVRDGNYFAFGNAKDAGEIDIWNESPDNKAVVRCNALKAEFQPGF